MQPVDVIGVAILFAELSILACKRPDRSRDSVGSRSSPRAIWITIGAGVVAAHALRRIHAGPEFVLGDVGRSVAIAAIVAGFALRVWSVATLGRFFTVDVAIREGHELIQSGPYRVVRHPSYTGLCAMFVGWSVLFENYAAAVALMLPFAIVILHRVEVEEATLVSAFGGCYEDYRSRTKRFLPLVY